MTTEQEQNLWSLVKPFYRCNDAGHKIDHVRDVVADVKRISRSQYLSTYLTDTCIVAAMFHDVTASSDRDNHHNSGADFAMSYSEQILDIVNVDMDKVCRAIREHRASYKGYYTGIVSEVLSCADRGSPKVDMSRYDRAYNYSIKSMPHDNACKVAHSHILEKYGPCGYAYDNTPLYREVYGEEIEKSTSFISHVTLKQVRDYLEKYR